AQLERAAQREYALGLVHEGILSPLPGGFHHDPELGPALIYPYDPDARRLDELLSDRATRLPAATRLRIIRQIADALRYAHGQGITHRGLSPRSVLVRLGDDDEPTVKVTDWQGAADADNAESLLQGTTNVDAVLADDARWYRAPESGWASRPDQVRADVFSLGAVAYRVLGGSFAAPDPAAYLDQLRTDGGLRLGATAETVPPAVTDLVYDATRVVAADRIPDLDTFTERLQAATAPTQPADPVPHSAAEPAGTHAAAGDILDGRWQVVRELGSGSTARAFLVADTANGGARKVLKIARGGPDADARLRAEAETLAGLDHPSVVRLAAGPVTIDGRAAIVTEQAGERTLEALLNSGPLAADQLERLGDALLEASDYLADKQAAHRDIKPANLGISAGPAGSGLVLFDFSHASLPMDDLEAGTRGYRDPFLSRDEVPGLPLRPRWDQAAEQYAVAVTLFRMATGEVPRYGTGQSHPQVVPDEAQISPSMFTSVRGSQRDMLAGFFRQALFRDARDRYSSIAAMRTAWRQVFSLESDTAPEQEQAEEPAAAPIPPDRDSLPATVRYASRLSYVAAYACALSVIAYAVNWRWLRLRVAAQFIGAPQSEVDTAVNVVPVAL
ncbi:MAG: protein kinase, partial [Actinobacteria bacterium]|nr:protein kinase [Actinomycetota bacterium]